MTHQIEPVALNPTSPMQDIMHEMKRLREAAGEHIANTATDMADTTAKKTAEYLMDAAIQRVQSLCEQEQAHEHVQSSLNTLMKRFNEKSTLTEAIEWYGRKTMFQKASLGILLVGSSALVGAVFNLSALFTVLSMGIFYLANTLLTEHYDLTEHQKKELANDIEKMEQTLFESVAALKDATKKLDDIFLKMLEQRIQSAHLLKAFEVQTSTLDEQVHACLNILARLNETNATLIHEHQRVVQQLEKAHMDMEQANATILTQSTSLDTIGLKLEETHDALRKRNDELATIHTRFQDNLTLIEELKTGFSDELLILKARGLSNEHAQVMNEETAPPSIQPASDGSAFIKKHHDLLDTIRVKQTARKRMVTQFTPDETSDMLATQSATFNSKR